MCCRSAAGKEPRHAAASLSSPYGAQSVSSEATDSEDVLQIAEFYRQEKAREKPEASPDIEKLAEVQKEPNRGKSSKRARRGPAHSEGATDAGEDAADADEGGAAPDKTVAPVDHADTAARPAETDGAAVNFFDQVYSAHVDAKMQETLQCDVDELKRRRGFTKKTPAQQRLDLDKTKTEACEKAMLERNAAFAAMCAKQHACLTQQLNLRRAEAESSLECRWREQLTCIVTRSITHPEPVPATSARAKRPRLSQ